MYSVEEKWKILSGTINRFCSRMKLPYIYIFFFSSTNRKSPIRCRGDFELTSCLASAEEEDLTVVVPMIRYYSEWRILSCRRIHISGWHENKTTFPFNEKQSEWNFSHHRSRRSCLRNRVDIQSRGMVFGSIIANENYFDI